MKDVLYCNLVTLFLTDGKFANLTADNADNTDNTDLHGSEKETPTTEARRRRENSTINGFCKVKNGLFIAGSAVFIRGALCFFVRTDRYDYKLLKVSGFFLAAGGVFFSGMVSSMMIFFTP
jgi:hypothetical protein